MFRKLVILILSVIVTLSTAIGIYAWVTKPSSGIDLNVSTKEMFSASTEMKLGTTSLNSLHAQYNSTDYTINVTNTQISNATTGGVMPLSVSVAVEAFKNIKVRLKLVEYWTNSSDVSITRPNVFTWNYATSHREKIDSAGYFYYSEIILKDGSDVISFITSANVNTANLPANTTVRLSVIISAVQANREDIWDTENHKTKTFTFSSNANNQNINVVFSGVSNAMYGRGVYIEFKNANYHYVYIWHNRTSMTRQMSFQAGTYTVSINLVNHLDFNVTRSGNNITITISYGNPGNWGYEDLIFSPTMIAVWQPGVTYPKDAIVYYRDDDGGGVNAGYYSASRSNTNIHPDQLGWDWRKLSPYYESGTMYPAGTIVFYNGAFYISKTNNSAAITEAWAWERLDRAFSSGNTYATGDIIYHTVGNVTTWYFAYGSVGASQPSPQSWQNFRALGFTYNSFNIQKYRQGEYVLHNGNYYVATTNQPYEGPSASSQVWKQLGMNWTNVQSYPAGHIVFYNSNYYIALNNINAWASAPGSNSNWQLITHRGNYTTSPSPTYSRYQSVIYNGKRYFWNQAGNAPAGNPDVTTGWWLLGEEWHPKNTYVQYDLVFWDNSYWTLRSGTSTNQEPGVSGQWQELSDRWTPTNIYLNNQYTRSMVIYNGMIFMWTGANNSNSSTPPSTAKNGWVELTEIWRSYNTYVVGDRVIYDGSFWEALQSPYDGSGNPIVPGTNFQVWKEYQIIWDPNRT